MNPPPISTIIHLDHATITAGENARKYFDPLALDALKGSIRQFGVLQNISVSPHPEVEGQYVICAGERRWRATCNLCAELETEGNLELLHLRRYIKAEVLSPEDAAKAYELGMVENLQRENITPIEEADAFYQMEHRTNPATGQHYTHEEIALTAGKLTKDRKPDAYYVRRRLKLRNAPESVLKLVNEHSLAPTVGELIGRVPDPKSREELAQLVLNPKEQPLPLNYVQTRSLIQAQFMVSLRGCGFDTEDADLLPVEWKETTHFTGKRPIVEELDTAPVERVRVRGGACTDCPFRSGNNPEIQDELASSASRKGKEGGFTSGVASDLCTNPSCFRAKQDAVWMISRRHAEAKGQKCIDGDAARKIFSGYEGKLAYDSGYANAGDVPGWQLVGNNDAPPWSKLMKDAGVKMVIVRNPHTNAQVQLVPIKDVIDAVKKQAKADGKKSIFDKAEERRAKPQSDAERKAEEYKRERQANIDAKAEQLLMEAFAEKLKTVKPGDADIGRRMVDRYFDQCGWSDVLLVYLGLDRNDVHSTKKMEAAFNNAYEADAKVSPHSWIKWVWLLMIGDAIHGAYQALDECDEVKDLAKAFNVDLAKVMATAVEAFPEPIEKPKAEEVESKPKQAEAKPAKKGKRSRS